LATRALCHHARGIGDRASAGALTRLRRVASAIVVDRPWDLRVAGSRVRAALRDDPKVRVVSWNLMYRGAAGAPRQGELLRRLVNGPDVAAGGQSRLGWDPPRAQWPEENPAFHAEGWCERTASRGKAPGQGWCLGAVLLQTSLPRRAFPASGCLASIHRSNRGAFARVNVKGAL